MYGTSVFSTVVAIALCGGLLAIERRGVLQLMLARPLIAGTLVGALGGEVLVGAQVGAVLELVYLARASLGAVQVDHECLAAVVGAGFAVGFSPQHGAAVGILVGPLAGILGRHVEHWLDARAGRRVEAFLATPNPTELPRAHLMPLAETFLVFAALSPLGILLGLALRPVVPDLPPMLLRGLDLTIVVATLATAGAALRELSPRNRYLLAAAGAVGAYLFRTGGVL